MYTGIHHIQKFLLESLGRCHFFSLGGGGDGGRCCCGGGGLLRGQAGLEHGGLAGEAPATK